MTHFDVSNSFRLDATDADASPLLPAPGREAYLAWVTDWKAALALVVDGGDAVQGIRALKAVRRDRSRTDAERNGANIRRQALRIEAHNLFELRKAAKRAAARERGGAVATAA